MNEEFKHSLSGLLYNMHFGSYEEVDDFSHSKKGQTWKKHKYIRKENGKYIYPKGTSGLNTKRQNASQYSWKNEYSNELKKYKYNTIDMSGIGKLHVYKSDDGTVVVLHPGHAKYTLPPGTDIQALESRLKNAATQLKNADNTGSSSYLKNETGRFAGQDMVNYDYVKHIINGEPGTGLKKGSKYANLSDREQLRSISEKPEEQKMADITKNRIKNEKEFHEYNKLANEYAGFKYLLENGNPKSKDEVQKEFNEWMKENGKRWREITSSGKLINVHTWDDVQTPDNVQTWDNNPNITTWDDVDKKNKRK